jgi:GrpB-like predicted nucleotidyltransferase (UPF0157 family)
LSPTLELASYDPDWPRAFEAERERLRAALGAVATRIEHHGSTAVPGLCAKPILDIQVSVRALQPMEAYAAALRSLGYVHHPHPDDAFAPFFHRPEGWPHTHHVHVVVSGGGPERETLAFRDYLREHPEVAREYEALKATLAPRFESTDFTSRQAYADAKGEFVRRVTREALERGYPR